MRGLYWQARGLARAAWPWVMLPVLVGTLFVILHSLVTLTGVTPHCEIASLLLTTGVISYVRYGQGILATILQVIVITVLARSSRLEL